MEWGILFGVAVIAALLVVLYWVYSFAIAPFRVLARYGIHGPSPVPLQSRKLSLVYVYGSFAILYTPRAECKHFRCRTGSFEHP